MRPTTIPLTIASYADLDKVIGEEVEFWLGPQMRAIDAMLAQLGSPPPEQVGFDPPDLAKLLRGKGVGWKNGGAK